MVTRIHPEKATLSPLTKTPLSVWEQVALVVLGLHCKACSVAGFGAVGWLTGAGVTSWGVPWVTLHPSESRPPRLFLRRLG
ncbi:MAG: hypothetical protein AB1609_08880 [Bacillota bacterium]